LGIGERQAECTTDSTILSKELLSATKFYRVESQYFYTLQSRFLLAYKKERHFWGALVTTIRETKFRNWKNPEISAQIS
jgi:hypothetical protein